MTEQTVDRQVAAALDYLRPGDTLCVWKLDRLGRSVKQVLTIADDLHERGIGLRILTGRLAGTYTPTGEGRFFFTMMAAFAELERDMLRERSIAGLAAARPRRWPAAGHGRGQDRGCPGPAGQGGTRPTASST